jgi:hypothetical protein
MTDTKRDESKDVAVRWDWDYSETSDETWTFPADDCCVWGHPDAAPNAKRYVPHSHLLAETERADRAETGMVDCSGCKYNNPGGAGKCAKCRRSHRDMFEAET